MTINKICIGQSIINVNNVIISFISSKLIMLACESNKCIQIFQKGNKSNMEAPTNSIS